jgi:hypothetical protein
MFQTVQKWRVEIKVDGTIRSLFWLHDNHMSNVLSAVSKMSFTEHSLTQPTQVCISLVQAEEYNASVPA